MKPALFIITSLLITAGLALIPALITRLFMKLEQEIEDDEQP